MPAICVCDDESAVRFAVEEALDTAGFSVVPVDSAEKALRVLGDVDAVLTDLVMPGMNGLELLAKIKKEEPDLPVVLLTARGSERAAVDAMKAGAYDYLTKPFRVDDIRTVMARACETGLLRKKLKQSIVEQRLGKPLVGQSPRWVSLISDAMRVARRDITVLIRGETGTGKEMIGSVLHAYSHRSKGPCVRFNCAAITPELAEAQLFGYQKGAFTGAINNHRGYFSQAHGGTLILDEIAELPLSVQAKLLRAIQENEIQPLGSPRVEKIDVRIVCCTHRDLKQMVSLGQFREDLYYRLAVVELIVPALHERRDDIPLLVELFRQRYSERFGLPQTSFSPSLIAKLQTRDWPGNVRELENTIARLLATSEGGELDDSHLVHVQSNPVPNANATSGNFWTQLEHFERSVLSKALADCSGNQSEAARRLGITRTTLLDKLKKLGIK